MKKIRYATEGILLHILFTFFRILPPRTASSIGGWIGRSLGPKLAASRKARRHIATCLPNLSSDEQDKVLIGMWDNLGRVIAEYPHLEKIGVEHTTIENQGRVEELLKTEQPIVFFGGHIANWEVNSIALLAQYDKPITLTYRAPNNPWTDRLLNKARTLDGRLSAYPKSPESGRKILSAMRKNDAFGILIDQKYNEGVEVPFFGQPAMTNPIFVQLCQKFKCPLIPVKNVRLGGCEFRLTPYPPLKLFDSNDNPRPVEDVIKDAHTLLETWIKEHPEQWIWMHRRWMNT